MSLVDYLSQLYARRETLRFLVGSSRQARRRDKLLGRLWNFLDPLLVMLVYLLVFGVFFRQARGVGGEMQIAEFTLYLLCGVLAWRFFEGSVSQATGCIRANRGLLHEINFPKMIFPLSICLSQLSDFLWGLLVLIVTMLVMNWGQVTVNVLWAPLIIVVQLPATSACVSSGAIHAISNS